MSKRKNGHSVKTNKGAFIILVVILLVATGMLGTVFEFVVGAFAGIIGLTVGLVVGVVGLVFGLLGGLLGLVFGLLPVVVVIAVIYLLVNMVNGGNESKRKNDDIL